MSAIGLRIPHPVIALVGAAALLVLSVGLVWLHMSPVVLLGGLLGIAGGILIWLHPYVGLHVFIAILFVENVFPAEEGVSAMQVIGGTIVLGWLMSIATRRLPGIRLDGFTFTVLAFLIWCGLSLIFALDASLAATRLFTFIQLGLAALMFRSVADTPGRLKGVYWGLVLWIWISTIVGIAEYYLGLTPTVSGLVKNRNLMACYINIAIVCAYLLYGMTSHRGARLFLASSLPVFFLGVGLTFSRAGLIVLCFSMMLVWYFAVRLRSFLILFASAALLLTITFVLPEIFWKRAGSIVPAIRHQEDTFGSRVMFWRVGWAMVRDRPLTGVGAGNYNLAFPRYARSEMKFSTFATHNAYVGMAAETGLIGLALYLLLHLQPLWVARRVARWALMSDRPELHLLAVAAGVSILSMMIGALSGDAQTLKMLWIWLGLAAGVGAMVPSAPLAARLDAREHDGERLSARAGTWEAPL